MAEPKIIYSMAAYKQIRHMHAEVVKDYADKLAELCGEGFEVTLQDRPNTQRPRAFVAAETPEARAKEAKHALLMKGLASLRWQT